MNLSIGIVGLPNAGKSTLFNALLKRHIAQVANYPFTTIKENIGVVVVPDERFEKLKELIKPEKTVPAAVEFIDIAGLVKNAHKGEGLGNQFLAKIREVKAIIHLIRNFEDTNVSHFYGSVDPLRDKEIVDLELELGGINKPTLYILNCQGPELKGAELKVKETLFIDAKTQQGVDELIQQAYKLLNLITFYTIKGGKEITARAIEKGGNALKAASLVHSDFAKNFIKAHVISFEDFVKFGGWTKARELGKVRFEGADYEIKDGEVVEFKVGC